MLVCLAVASPGTKKPESHLREPLQKEALHNEVPSLLSLHRCLCVVRVTQERLCAYFSLTYPHPPGRPLCFSTCTATRSHAMVSPFLPDILSFFIEVLQGYPTCLWWRGLERIDAFSEPEATDFVRTAQN